MRRTTLSTVAILALIASCAVLLLALDRNPRSIASPAEVGLASPVAGTESTESVVVDSAVNRDEAAPARRDADPVAESAEMVPLDIIQGDDTLRDRLRQQELAEAADGRWAEAVDSGEYSADDLDPAIRDLFRRMTLEPRYAEGGSIDGLVIRSLGEDHPLAAGGFEAGDMIDRIQGMDLRDPAALPSLLAHLGPHVEFCARQARTGEQLCRELVLDR